MRTRWWGIVLAVGLGLAVFAAVAPGCAEVGELSGEPELGSAEGVRCPSCGMNGLEGGPSDALPTDMGLVALRAAGLWPEDSVGPLSICEPGTIADRSCEIRLEWRDWIVADRSGMRVEQFDYLIKVAAPYPFTIESKGVLNSSGEAFGGDFGIAPRILGAEWSMRDQELVTGGLAAVLNVEPILLPHFDICLKTDDFPQCTGADRYVESIFYGNIFQGARERVMQGGPDAPDPMRNLRTGLGGSPRHLERHHKWEEGKCLVAKQGASRVAISCEDGRWQYPVAVLTTFRPSAWYYDTGGQPGPVPPGAIVE